MDEKVVELKSKWKQLIDLYASQNGISNLYTNSSIFSPYSQNNRLKNLKTKPARYSRSQIENMLLNPASSEKDLRSASWYFYHNITPISKQMNLYADILTYRWWVVPSSSKIENISKFHKNYETAVELVNSLNPKKVFREIVLDVMREGKVPYCVRTNGNKIFLQRLPSDYVKIIYKTEVGWQIAFNMMYFSTEGASVDFFPPIFKDLYSEFSSIVNKKTGEIVRGAKIPDDVVVSRDRGSFYYWKEIPVDVGVIFSFDDTIPDVIPPLAAQFIDAGDLDAYKLLQQELLQIPLNQILTATVPFAKDNKSGSYIDDTAITPELCLVYESAIRQSLPKNVDFVAAPFENFNLFSFDDTMNRNNVVGNAIQNFYNESLGGLINTADKPSMAAITTQQKIETRLIDKIYEQFKIFVNNQFAVHKIDMVKFKIDGNVFADQNKLDAVRKEISSGNSAMYYELLSFYDFDFVSFMNSLDIINDSDLFMKLQVPPTSYTGGMAGAEGAGAGRPSKPIEEMTNEGSVASAEREINTSVGRGLKSE